MFFKTIAITIVVLACWIHPLVKMHASELALHPNEAEIDLQHNEETSWEACLAEFTKKKGTFLRVENQQKITLLPGDAVYPICSGGFCRSQTLWVILKEHRDKILLFPPHAARYGFDPYNGKVNWHRNDSNETIYDEFELWAKEPKRTRFGYDAFHSWTSLNEVSEEKLKQISDYYNNHYFGPESSLNGQQGKRRVYVSFDKNTHVVLLRLNQANHDLDHVFVVHFPLLDLVTHPLPEWNTFSRSAASYREFATLLSNFIEIMPQ